MQVEKALAATLNLSSQKDRDLRVIELLELQVDLLRRIERNTMPAYSPAVAFKLSVTNTVSGATGETNMNLLLGENAKVEILGIKDAAGNDAKIEGDKVTWSVSGDQDLGELQVSEDTKSVLFVRNGKPGTCSVEARGDADLTEGVKEIVGVVELVCLGGEAVKFEMNATAVPA